VIKEQTSVTLIRANEIKLEITAKAHEKEAVKKLVKVL
jgi:hypothetical protein